MEQKCLVVVHFWLMHTVPLTNNLSVHVCPLASDSKATRMCMFANSCVCVYLHVRYTHAMRVKHLWITKLNTSHSHECDCDFRVHCVCMCKCTYSCERLARAAKLPMSGIVHTLFHCGVYTLPLWSVHSLLLLIVLPVYKYMYIHVPLMWTCIGHGSAVFICIHFFFFSFAGSQSSGLLRCYWVIISL